MGLIADKVIKDIVLAVRKTNKPSGETMEKYRELLKQEARDGIIRTPLDKWLQEGAPFGQESIPDGKSCEEAIEFRGSVGDAKALGFTHKCEEGSKSLLVKIGFTSIVLESTRGGMPPVSTTNGSIRPQCLNEYGGGGRHYSLCEYVIRPEDGNSFAILLDKGYDHTDVFTYTKLI
jgi:hypothetical protein